MVSSDISQSTVNSEHGQTSPPKLSKSKRILYGAFTAAVVILVIEAMSWGMIAILPHHAPRRAADIYDEQSAQIRRFLDTSTPRLLVPHPVFGWCYGPNIRSDDHNSNSKGLRGSKEYTPVAAPNILRIAAFGSSIVYCSEVNDANSWPALIEASNPDIEVLNYGVGGYGTDQAYLRYLAEGLDLDPDVVLIGFTTDELGRTVNVYRRFITSRGQAPLFKPRYLLGADGQLTLLEVPVRSREDYLSLLENPAGIIPLGRHDEWYEASVYETPLYDYSAALRWIYWTASHIHRRHIDNDRLFDGDVLNESSTAFQIQVHLLAKFIDSVRANCAVPIVVLFPEQESVQSALEGRRTLYDPLRKHLQDRGIDYLDVIEAFQKAGTTANPQRWFAANGHYSPSGNKVIATWLPKQIRSLVAINDRKASH
jgi:hypothetical protein